MFSLARGPTGEKEGGMQGKFETHSIIYKAESTRNRHMSYVELYNALKHQETKTNFINCPFASIRSSILLRLFGGKLSIPI